MGRVEAAANLDVGIVGAGLAGLACADRLQSQGILPALYEAGDRVGGRQYSLRNFFPGQVADRGGEFIDTSHKTLIAYSRRLGLTLEDVTKQPGAVVYYFNGRHYSEDQVVAEFRAFVAAMDRDLRRLSSEVTADNHSDVDVAYDRTSLAAYLDGQNSTGTRCGPLARSVIEQAYIAEYGRQIEEQSCLNFLFFIHADRRSKFTPFGVFSDERYHVLEGNDRIASGLAAGLARRPELGMRLVRIRRKAGGGVELTLRSGSKTQVRSHDAVVVTVPFSVLRGVEIDANLDLPAWKVAAINQLGYGDNAKMMVGFTSRPWSGLGGNGAAYADLANVQATCETSPATATAAHAVLTDYSGGVRGANLNRWPVQTDAANFLSDLEQVFPGVQGAAMTSRGKVLAHMEHWPSNPLTKGSYTCYLPGQFTTIAGNEGKRVGNLLFAEEHTDSFYSYQGFMEGAALSRLRAANELLQQLKASR